MNNLKTKIVWNINDYCSYQCSYCPVHFWGGGEPPETKEYIQIANLIIDSYRAMGRSISWEIGGGEPLDMNDIVTLLKLCRENGEFMELHTNGGKLWMDWWAIEPYVDKLHLTYHYWQNVSLINYIIETYQKKNKEIILNVPMRPAQFEEDLARAEDIESRYNIFVIKQALYNNADKSAGMISGYTEEQLDIMSGKVFRTNFGNDLVPLADEDLSEEQQYFNNTTWEQRYQDRMNSHPRFGGQMCNAGIEFLNISAQGWVSGSLCNNEPLGNIWHKGWKPPCVPQKCGMIVCEFPSDQLITKFPLTVNS